MRFSKPKLKSIRKPKKTNARSADGASATSTTPISPLLNSLLIISGEASGDLYGRKLADHFKQMRPGLTVHAIGGDQLKEVADVFLYHSAYKSVVGLAGTLFKSHRYRAVLKALKKAVSRHRYNAAIIIDYQHFNFMAADVLKEAKIPIMTYVTPNFWLWGDRDAIQAVCDYSRLIVCIFKKEYHLYRRYSDNVVYFGHPLTEMITPKPFVPKSAFKHITLFPGSRLQEFKFYLKPMLTVAGLLQARFHGLEITIAVSSNRFRPLIEKQLSTMLLKNIQLYDGPKDDLLAKTDFLMVASGSSTLQAVLHRVPMVIFAALSPLTYLVARFVLQIKLPFVALPNIIADKEIIPEFVQFKINPLVIAHTIDTLFDNHRFQSLVSGYDHVINGIVDQPEPIRQAAEYMMALLTVEPGNNPDKTIAK